MGDVADILGMQREAAQSEAEKLLGMATAKTSSSGNKGPKKAARMGIPRELFNLVGKDGLAPLTTTKKGPSFKSKREDVARNHWVYSTFTNEARKDGVAIWYHWTKASETNLPIYPFAKFSATIPNLQYTDDEYNTYLAEDGWSKEETDELCRLCSHFELRWPVVADRFVSKKERPLEELQSRFYSVKERLEQARGELPDPVDGGQQRWSFNTAYERKRRKQLDRLFRRSKEEEEEEAKLKDELRNVEAALKKVRKHPANKSQVRQAAEVRDAIVKEETPQGIKTMPLVTDKLVQDPRPEPRPGQPFLQSARLSVPVLAPKLGKGMLNKIRQLHAELNLPPRPVPTMHVCDTLDALRKEVVELFTLLKVVNQKERQLEALKAGEDPTSVLGRGFTGDPTTALKGVVMGGAAALANDPRAGPPGSSAANNNNKRKGGPASGGGGRPPVALTSPGTSLIGGWGAASGGDLGGSGSSGMSEGDKKRLKRTSV